MATPTRPHRRSTHYPARVNLPLSEAMKKALEKVADKENLAVVEVIRRAINGALEEKRKSAAQTPPSKLDEALRQKLLNTAGAYLAKGSLLPDHEYEDAVEWEEPLSESSKEILRDELARLQLDSIITVLNPPSHCMGREEDDVSAREEIQRLDRQAKDLSLLLFRVVSEPNRLEFRRIQEAQERIIAAAFENSSASAEGG